MSLCRAHPLVRVSHEHDINGAIVGRSSSLQLAFPGYALERFSRALDAVLTIVAIRRQLADHLVGSARRRAGNVAGGEIDGFSNLIFVSQRPLLTRVRKSQSDQ